MTHDDVPAERGRDELPSLNDLRDWAGRWLDEHRAEAAHARRYAALLRSPEAPDDPFGTAEECEADAESADAEAAMYAAVLALLAQREAPTAGDIDSLDAAMKALHDQLYAEGREGDALIVERAAYAIEALETDRVMRAAPQEAPICLQCIERAEQEIAAGHYYRADELMAALRERREPVCACGETHPDHTPLAAARPAPETREPELLGYVVERQLTTGEWMRVWRGRTMWFDHDEAVLDRDAYALDGIPAHIRPVYLGAPAPAEARQVLALDAIRDVLGIDYDEDSAMWYLPAEPAPIECATLDDALRAYAKMAAPASGEPSGADAVVREAAPFSDTAVARIIEAVEKHCGMGHGAWDMVSARDLVEGFAAVFGADTRRIDAEAAVREAYEVIDELAPQWSGSSIATVLRAFITVVDDMAQRVQRIDSGPWRRP